MPRYRHLKRYRQIINSLVKHGFGHLLAQTGITAPTPVRSLFSRKKPPANLSRAQRLRTMLEELGPSFIKLGQILSTRHDLLPPDILQELAKLQDDVPPFPYEEAQSLIQQELGMPPEEAYASFTKETCAAASIGQVHFAVLKDGRKAVVKVRRPGIGREIQLDLEILSELAGLADRHTVWGKVYRLQEIIAELKRTVQEELDYLTEAENAAAIKKNLQDNSQVMIPEIFWELTTPAVLTMERMEGTKLNEKEKLVASGKNLNKAALLLVDAMFSQIFEHGVFHADPHPGNLALSENGRLIFMDFGIVGRLKGERKKQFTLFLLGVIRRNPRFIVRSLADMGLLSPRVNRRALRFDIERLMDTYLDLPLRKIELGKVIREVFALTYRYKIRVPSEFTLLGKTIITLEGVIEELDSNLKLIEMLQPYSGKLMESRFSSRVLKDSLQDHLWETSDFLLSLPRRAGDLIEHLEGEGVPVRLDYPELDRVFSHFDRITNRLSFSIVLLSFSIIMAALVIGASLAATPEAPFIVLRLPVMEIGFIVAGAMAGWLLWAIYRSGKL